jgi:MYXO-CTERM domain-containing protein
MTEQESWRPKPPADPSGIEAPHDVLAADEFGIGTSDERLPPDPHRFEPPHDILAAEEFAMPAAGQRRGIESAPAQGPRSRTPLLAIAAAVLLLLLLRRRR